MTTPAPPPPSTPGALHADSRKDSLIEYPCLFPIKVMGAKVDGFVHALTEVARQFEAERHQQLAQLAIRVIHAGAKIDQDRVRLGHL